MTANSPLPDYYRHYFLQMLSVVTERYGDLLSNDDLAFISAVHSCQPEPIRLLIRLYLRKGSLFLVNKLSYAEITDLETALSELQHQSLIEENPLAYAWELIDLLPVSQSRTVFGSDTKIRKKDLLEQWLDDKTLAHCLEWDVNDRIITPCHFDSFQRIQLLYFGNEHQNLTEFILEDIGLFQYEKYPLDETSRLFNSSEEINQYLELNALRDQFYMMHEAKNWSQLTDLARNALKIALPERLWNKWHRLLNRIAYRLEQLGEFDLAIQLFQTNAQPPSRERQVRILTKQAQFSEALALLKEINTSPLSADESLFHDRFVNKVRTRLNLDRIAVNKPAIQEIHQQWPRGEGSVEEQACSHFPGSVWLENSLPLGIFGLIYWDIIFQSVPGVWHHPFQAGPTDLNNPDFAHHRKASIIQLNQQSKEDWQLRIEQRWQEKSGLRNPFVNWNTLTLDSVLSCFQALGKSQWLGIFEHLLSDLRQFRSGFPDLFQSHEGKHRFIEIKGPGDKLQDNQINWLKVFYRLNIPVDVCYVQYIDD